MEVASAQSQLMELYETSARTFADKLAFHHYKFKDKCSRSLACSLNPKHSSTSYITYPGYEEWHSSLPSNGLYWKSIWSCRLATSSLMSLYFYLSARIRINGSLSLLFSIFNGTHQCCPLTHFFIHSYYQSIWLLLCKTTLLYRLLLWALYTKNLPYLQMICSYVWHNHKRPYPK